MKHSILLLSFSLIAYSLITQTALASGFIVVDRAVAVPVAVPRRLIGQPHPVLPSPPISLPPAKKPILKGAVSLGLHLQSEAIKVDVNDQVAKTHISQIFMNDTDQVLAGTYMFPLPGDTTFSSFSLHIDGKPVEGKILEANEARQQYEAIVRQMVDPGLLEYADYKTVRARIFPIPAHGTKKVELEYTQILCAENGLLKYNFPLKAQGNSIPTDHIKIDVKLSGKQNLRTIWSPTHTISAQHLADNQAKISISAHDVIPDKDFILYYSVSNKELAANLLAHKSENEEGYFLLTLSPPIKAQQIANKDIVLVVDTSGSMQGEKIDQCKRALKYIVTALGANDRFNIVQFNTDVEAFKPQVVPANTENKKAAEAFIDDLEARGGTNIDQAMHTGIAMLNENVQKPAYIVLMTDGEPTVGETNINALLKKISPKRDVRIFDFGVGYDVNTRLLNKLADQHHGTAQYVEPQENLETALSNFYEKIKNPVLSNVHIAYSGVQVKDVYPKEVKDIFVGSQVLLIGKYKNGGKAANNLTGQVNGEEKSYTFPLVLANDTSDHSYLPRLWAMRRIGHLTEIAQENQDNKEVVDEIISLSKKYGIISAYTSFLVTDPSENGRLHNVAVLPRAFNLDLRGRPMQASASPSRTVFYRAARQIAIAPMSESGDGSLLKGQTASYGSAAPDQVAQHIAAAPVPVTGKAAVAREKKISAFKEAIALKPEESSGLVKVIEEKTFYLKNGFWTDSSFKQSMSKHMNIIEFGSKKYFDLIGNTTGISKYLSAGKQVILVYKGHCYKITNTVDKIS